MHCALEIVIGQIVAASPFSKSIYRVGIVCASGDSIDHKCPHFLCSSHTMASPFVRSRIDWVTITISAFLIIVHTGCHRQPIGAYSLPESALELPEIQQESLRSTLGRVFGTPQEPRLLDVDEDADRLTSLRTHHWKRLPTRPIFNMGPPSISHVVQACHGAGGDGQGPAAEFLQPKPRDYRDGVFKFTSTPFGQKPARHDLVRTIRRGAKGTSMPAFPWMTDEDLEAVIDHVILLSQRGQTEVKMVQYAEFELEEEDAIALLDVLSTARSVRKSWEQAAGLVTRPATAEPAYDAASIKLGREIFTTENCFKCHGKDAKGQTEWLNPEFLAEQEQKPAAERILINYDQWKQPAPAADLTARMLRGGRRPLDIYRRIATGINGTPMPAFDTTFAKEPEKIWHLVHYVMHIVDGGDPELSDLE